MSDLAPIIGGVVIELLAALYAYRHGYIFVIGLALCCALGLALSPIWLR